MFWIFLINTLGILMMWVAFWFLLIITQKGGSTSKSSSISWSFFCSESGTAGSAGRKKNEQLFVFLQAAGTAEWNNGVLAARLEGMPRPDPEQLFPETRKDSRQRDLLGVKRTIIPSFGGCRSGHWVRLQRTIIRFPDPGRSGPEQKKPRAVKLGA